MICHGVGDYEILGETLDDAAGEALDKVARLVGLDGGGIALEQRALDGNSAAVPFKLPLQKGAVKDRTPDLSFSGLKTAARRAVETQEHRLEDLCASFQEIVCRHIATQTGVALRLCQARGTPLSRVVLGGGVAANARLKERLREACEANGAVLVVPPPRLCTDNGVMVAWAGVERYVTPPYVHPTLMRPSPLRLLTEHTRLILAGSSQG